MRRTAPTVRNPILRLIVFVLVMGVAAVIPAVTVYPILWAAGASTELVQKQLDTAAQEGFHAIEFPESSYIYTADGRQLTQIDSGENRKVIKLDRVAPVAQQAILAIEDHRFYKHGGIDTEAILRAAAANFRAGSVEQGASTITQQLVKNAIIGSAEQTFERKFQEAALAMRMEREYTKDEILELYLNEVYFANGVYGIGTASEYYFDKPASQLNLPEAALLAGIVQDPTLYDPDHSSKQARIRRNIVIDAMAAPDANPAGTKWNDTTTDKPYISPREAKKAKQSDIRLKIQEDDRKNQPFITQYIIHELLTDRAFQEALGRTEDQRQLNLGRKGLRVYTTLDPKMIEAAQKAAVSNLGLNDERQAAIATVEVGDGAVVSLLSGQDYDHQQRNLVVANEVGGVWQGVRQPGSSFKPFTLVAAFEEGISPETTFSSASPWTSQEWDGNACHCVYNAEGAGAGGMENLWDATKYSTNVVFAQLAVKIGGDKIALVAERMGVKEPPLVGVPSITLGSEATSPLEMASGYATLANEGTYCRPYVVSRIETLDGKVVYRHRPECREVVDPNIANTVTKMLEGVVLGGTGTAANLGSRPVAGKTGTSQDSADLWFVGYVPQYATAVWVGHPKGRVPMEGSFGGTVAAPIWHDYMSDILRGIDIEQFGEATDKIRGKFGDAVPDVVGMKVDDATAELEAAGFTVRTNTVESEEDRNLVVAQSPGGGDKAEMGSAVNLDVSSGRPAKTEVPSVVGMQEHEASTTLQDAGFGVKIVYEIVSQADKNRIVLRQSPGGGAEAEDGAGITLYVGDYSK